MEAWQRDRPIAQRFGATVAARPLSRRRRATPSMQAPRSPAADPRPIPPPSTYRYNEQIGRMMDELDIYNVKSRDHPHHKYTRKMEQQHRPECRKQSLHMPTSCSMKQQTRSAFFTCRSLGLLKKEATGGSTTKRKVRYSSPPPPRPYSPTPRQRSEMTHFCGRKVKDEPRDHEQAPPSREVYVLRHEKKQQPSVPSVSDASTTEFVMGNRHFVRATRRTVDNASVESSSSTARMFREQSLSEKIVADLRAFGNTFKGLQLGIQLGVQLGQHGTYIHNGCMAEATKFQDFLRADDSILDNDEDPMDASIIHKFIIAESFQGSIDNSTLTDSLGTTTLNDDTFDEDDDDDDDDGATFSDCSTQSSSYDTSSTESSSTKRVNYSTELYRKQHTFSFNTPKLRRIITSPGGTERATTPMGSIALARHRGVRGASPPPSPPPPPPPRELVRRRTSEETISSGFNGSGRKAPPTFTTKKTPFPAGSSPDSSDWKAAKHVGATRAIRSRRRRTFFT